MHFRLRLIHVHFILIHIYDQPSSCEDMFDESVKYLAEINILVPTIGQWISPTGTPNLHQHSQLLLAYFAIGADIQDMLELFNDIALPLLEGIAEMVK